MENKSTYLEKINKAIDTIRPYLQADGGDIVLRDLTDDLIVKVQLLGACDGCPFSIQTMRSGVEQAIKKEVPEIKGVVTIEE